MKKIIIVLSAVAVVTAVAFTAYNSGKGISTNNEGMVETTKASYDSSLTKR